MTSDSNHPSNGTDIGPDIYTDELGSGSTYFRRDNSSDLGREVLPNEFSPEPEEGLLGELADSVDSVDSVEEDVEPSVDVVAPKIAGVTAFPGVSAAVLSAAASAAASAEPNQAPVSGARLALVTSSTPERQAAVQSDIDRMSLEQALLDVEVANARVIDLTARLVEANQRSTALRAEADGLRAQITAAAAEVDAQTNHERVELAAKAAEIDARAAHLEAQKASTAYRWAAKVWNLRNAIKN